MGDESNHGTGTQCAVASIWPSSEYVDWVSKCSNASVVLSIHLDTMKRGIGS
ncbi:hypothetical protein SERLA73DRAFT_121183 [Serpula lacrymans var. lacrymans S7.3]|uniref:Uncharacterized protein n=1 Tax=Serpula lacrymans var. lacrymans (strain S7.3) TaxID=936435 RepID=F8PSD8_SERL3|nr:hypothetical protein SERLA73DRAFT_121183 [Serpula lacrymans var. lacrymans S7.3]